MLRKIRLKYTFGEICFAKYCRNKNSLKIPIVDEDGKSPLKPTITVQFISTIFLPYLCLILTPYKP